MAKGKDLQSQEIKELLRQLGDELTERGFVEPVRVLLVGGAYMSLVIGSRRTTQDIDVFPLNFPASSQPDGKTKTILAAIKAVAKKNGLKADWLNDAVAGILGELQPEESQLQLWQSYGALDIFVASPDFVLTTKLIGYRDKDYHDVRVLLDFLHLEVREQALAVLLKYGVDAAAQREYFIDEALDNFFDA